jgi:hypothetical protein
MLVLYCSGTPFLRATILNDRLSRSSELVTALHYPVRDRDFFRWQVGEWLVTCSPVFLLAATSYVFVAAYDGVVAAPLVVLALLGGLVQAVIVITLSLSLTLWFRHIRPQPLLALYVLMACIFYFPTAFAPLNGKTLICLPATWVNLWFTSFELGPWNVILVLASIGLLAAVDARLLWSLAKGYPQTDVTLVLEQIFHPPANEDDLASPSGQDRTPFGHDYAVAQEQFAALRNRAVAVDLPTKSDVDWKAGHWTTRLAGRWLTPRQRVVAEFLSANAIDTWRSREKRGVQFAAFGVFLCAIPAVPFWLPLSVFIMAALTGAPVWGGRWPGLTAGGYGFTRLQSVAGYPIGYVEASLSIMKVNAIRLVGFAPTALIAGLSIGWRYFGQPMTGLFISAQIVLISLAVQPYCSVFLHSAGTNDTRQLNWTTLAFACALIASVLIFGLGIILFFAFDTAAVRWVTGAAVVVLVPWSTWRFYGFLYFRHRIDLIAAYER